MAASPSITLPVAPDQWKRRRNQTSHVLGALPRWKILLELAGEMEWMSVSYLAGRVGIERSGCSKHMADLAKAGLVEQGMGRLYRLAPAIRPAPGAEFLDLGVCQLRLRPVG